MEKITYKCKKCRWQVSIPALWEDLKPAVCGNKKCKTSFKKMTEQLDWEIVGTQAPTTAAEEKVFVTENRVDFKQQKDYKKSQQQMVKKEESDKEEEK